MANLVTSDGVVTINTCDHCHARIGKDDIVSITYAYGGTSPPEARVVHVKCPWYRLAFLAVLGWLGIGRGVQ